MNAEEMARWSFDNTYKNIWNPGDPRLMTQLPELRRLAEAALESTPQNGMMVEIGVFAGCTLSILLQVARERNAVVWAADPWGWQTDVVKPKFIELLQNFKHDVDLHFCRLQSDEMRAIFPERRSIDLLHIDGDHMDMLHDFQMWCPLVGTGHLAVFHDMVDSNRCGWYGNFVDSKNYLDTNNWQIVWWAKEEEFGQMCARKP